MGVGIGVGTAVSCTRGVEVAVGKTGGWGMVVGSNVGARATGCGSEI
jgi:hypothetical protein